MFTNAELVKSETINGRLQLTVRGIFHAIKDIECYRCKLIVHCDNQNNRKNLTDMILLNDNTGLYESVKGMYDGEFEEGILDIAMNHVYLKKTA
ncbi:hypothetical protein AB1K32_26975 [Metabacillus dongyingensis]|uniref:hypothetical protein n=1 Tax=Metabacillus dongyingensis TaxID=2874282 RepID=UPI003B8D6437